MEGGAAARAGRASFVGRPYAPGVALPPTAPLIVPAALAGSRLDRALVELVAGPSRSRIQEWIRGGRVRVDGRVEKRSGLLLEAGARIEIEQPARPAPLDPAQARARLPLLEVDEHWVAVDKPAGMLTHGGEESVATLASAIFGPLPTAQGADRPGIVHRLDRDTSGVLVLGRNERALSELLRQFREREVEKTYLAIVHGEPRFESDWIEKPLGREPGGERVVVLPEGEGRAASTYYELRERLGDFALLACKPLTGRTHQIRVHLSSIGHPLLGEPLYRRRDVQSRPAAHLPEVERQMLHAHELVLAHPASGERHRLRAPLPADFEGVLARLRALRRG